MADLPKFMYQENREVDPVFAPDERLFRRVPPELWDADDDIDLDTIELPDMSVTREKYGPPSSSRWVGDDYWEDWGVIGFRAEDVPPQIKHLGIYVYKFRVEHAPLRRNYPHSEVRAYEVATAGDGGETHIGKLLMERITPDVHQRWREQLRRRCRIVLQPGPP